jgi:predicted NUDIX family phosphoesterase/thymidylate kinase
MDVRTMDVEHTIKELEALANTVLDLKNEVIPRRPIVIEFCGSPKSGKTSCINSLDLFFRRNKFRTRVLSERASVCPVRNKYDPYFNLWTVTSVVAELSEVLSNHSKDYDVVLMDRGIFDALCWFNWLLSKKHLDENNFESIEHFLTMSRWRSVVDLVYVFTAEPKISLEREFANLLTRKMGSIMHPDVLASYKKTIEESKKRYSSMFKKIEHIDTSETSLNDVNYQVTNSILNILHDNTAERVGYLNRACISLQKEKYFSYSNIESPAIALQFDVRRQVETDSSKLQPIPILVITNKQRNKVLVVKKNKKQTSRNSPESQKTLVYLGGHIRQEDLIESEDDDLLSVSRYAIHREVKEEIGIDYYPEKNGKPICIWDTSNDRSEKHLAMCHVMEADFDALKIKLDKNEFITTGQTKSGKVLDIKELVANDSELEEWSRIILAKVFNCVLPSAQETLNIDNR